MYTCQRSIIFVDQSTGIMRRGNPVFDQYRKEREEEEDAWSEGEDECVDVNAFQDITPSSQSGTAVQLKVGVRHGAVVPSAELPTKPPLMSSSSSSDADGPHNNDSSSLPEGKGDTLSVPQRDSCAGINSVVDSFHAAADGRDKYLVSDGDEFSPHSASNEENQALEAPTSDGVGEELEPRRRSAPIGEGSSGEACVLTQSRTMEKYNGLAAAAEDEGAAVSGSNAMRSPLREVFRAPSLSHVDTEDVGGTIPVSFWESVLLLREDTAWWRRYAPVPAPQSKAKRSFLDFFSCIPKRDKAKERYSVSPVKEPVIAEDLSFCTALLRIPFDHDNPVLHRVLYTIYHSLAAPETLEPWWKRKKQRLMSRQPTLCTGEREGRGSPMLSCRIAWDRVGFQGEDPATDLRATGLLGLLHMLYLIDQYPCLTARLWQVCRGDHNSRSDVHLLGEELPFALVCFNISGFVVDSLMGGALKERIKGKASSLGAAVEPPSEGRTEEEEDLYRYSQPSEEERAMTTRCPVMASSSDYFIGCVYGFVEAWLRYAKKKHPQKLTVADFHDIRNILFYKWNRKGKECELFQMAEKARRLSLNSLLGA